MNSSKSVNGTFAGMGVSTVSVIIPRASSSSKTTLLDVNPDKKTLNISVSSPKLSFIIGTVNCLEVSVEEKVKVPLVIV